MSTLATSKPLRVRMNARASAVKVSDDSITVDLRDGRIIIVPIVWFPRLSHATPEQRSNCEIIADGEGIHWPDVDEDLSIAGFLRSE